MTLGEKALEAARSWAVTTKYTIDARDDVVTSLAAALLETAADLVELEAGYGTERGHPPLSSALAMRREAARLREGKP